MTHADIDAVALALVLALLYFVPTLIAWRRRHHQLGPIVLVNLLLGWSVIGWFFALVWACTATRRPLDA